MCSCDRKSLPLISRRCLTLDRAPRVLSFPWKETESPRILVRKTELPHTSLAVPLVVALLLLSGRGVRRCRTGRPLTCEQMFDIVSLYLKHTGGHMGSTRRQRLDATVTAIQGRFGPRALYKLGGPSTLPIIPTGFGELDAALGINGLPQGHVTELLGCGSAGHLTLAAHLLRQTQRRRQAAIYVDLDRAIDLDYLARCGVRLEALIVLRPADGPQALGMVRDLAGEVTGAIVIHRGNDLLALFCSDYQALKAWRRLRAVVQRSRCALIVLSDLDGPHPNHSLLGGQASLRLLLEHQGWLYQGPRIVGFLSRISILKHSLGPRRTPFLLTIPICGEERP
jgi:hypothetical protein